MQVGILPSSTFFKNFFLTNLFVFSPENFVFFEIFWIFSESFGFLPEIFGFLPGIFGFLSEIYWISSWNCWISSFWEYLTFKVRLSNSPKEWDANLYFYRWEIVLNLIWKGVSWKLLRAILSLKLVLSGERKRAWMWKYKC